MVRALRPDYHPDKVVDPAWVAHWRSAYSAQPPGFVPLLNTAGEQISPEFIAANAVR